MLQNIDPVVKVWVTQYIVGVLVQYDQGRDYSKEISMSFLLTWTALINELKPKIIWKWYFLKFKSKLMPIR